MRLKAGFAAVLLAFFVASCSGCVHMGTGHRENLFKKLYLSTVVIEVETPGSAGMGSGVVIQAVENKSIVLTCAHVVDGALNSSEKTKITVAFKLGDKEYNYLAIVMASDSERDLALLMVPSMDELAPVRIADKEPKLYSDLYLMGAPLEYDGTASVGMLTHKNRDQGPRTVWQISNGVIIFGISGGPVVNENGELVCIANSFAAHTTPIAIKLGSDIPPVPAMARVPYTSIGFCVPLPSIKTFIGPYVHK